MKAKIFIVAVALILSPVIIFGLTVNEQANNQTAVPRSGGIGQGLVDFLVGDNCSLPVYHTNFAFPPEGGKIVRSEDDLYFVKTYLPGCESAMSTAPVVRGSNTQTQIQTNTINSTNTNINQTNQVNQATTSQGFGSSFVEFLTGNPCLVPVYNTSFAFPSEGGRIIQIGDELFFHRDYLSGCENISGTLIRGS